MANTYTQLYAQIVFSPKGRANLITKNIKDDVHKYIIGVIKGCNLPKVCLRQKTDDYKWHA